MADPAIKLILLLHLPLVSLIESRIYAQMIPQQVQGARAKTPCVVFSLVGTTEVETLCGTDDFVASVWQLDAYSKDRDQAIAVAGAVRNALVHYSGTAGGVYVNRIRRDSILDIGPEQEPGLFRRLQTFTIWYVEN